MSGTSSKSRDAMRTIGEASAELNIKTHILRYWEAQFDALQPLKRAGGRRYYRPEDMAMLREIDRLVNRERYTIKGAQKYLRNKGVGTTSHEPDGQISVSQSRSHDDIIDRLQVIRNTLATALANN